MASDEDDNDLDSRLAKVRARMKRLENIHTKSADKFSQTLDELVKLKGEEEALLIIKKIVVDAFTRIVERTPVDTGRARAGWQFEVGKAQAWTPPEGIYDALKDAETKRAIKAAVEDELKRIREASPEALWIISNHLDYIGALEAGWSKQAPSGMVAITLQELRRRLAKKYSL